MSEAQDQSNQRSHWDELARQLGLEPEPVSTPPPEAPAARPPREEEPPQAVEVEREEPTPLPPEEPSAGRGRRRPEVAAEEREFASEFLQEEAVTPDEGEAPPVLPLPEGEGDEDIPVPAPRRGRGRGRRSSRGGRNAEPEVATEPAVEGGAEKAEAGEEGETEKPKERGRRGRGRGRRTKAAAHPEGAEAVENGEGTARAGEVQAPEPDEGDDKEEVDNLSDWNVPSWQELIDSLYRPDR